jgi:2,4-dienoyl-CoA reductase-like NADH-dependent reductase (Old Yellow Enzyme family)
MTQHPNLISPLTLRGHSLRNRIVFGAHTNNMSDQGIPGPRMAGYLVERALGGAAMIVTEPVPVHRTGVLTRGNLLHSDDEIIPHFRKITDAVKQAGAVICQQLYHIGAHGDGDLSFAPHWSPSGGRSYHDSDGSHAMTESQIHELLDAHLAAAIRAKKSGFHGVEVWAAYHSLLDQFWTPWSNQRTDQWGGSLQNRTRFSRVLIENIRRACGDEFIIGLAISYAPNYSVTLSAQDLCEIIALHDATGHVDYVTCGAGSYLEFDAIIPPFTHGEKLTTPLTAQLKSLVKHAKIIAEAGVRTPDNGEEIIRSGQADMVSIVRGQIADPHLARKTIEGRADDIRGCISCNQMCWGRRSRDYWISCLINPSAGREFEWGGDRFLPTDNPQNLLVIGAGPAGLEAARVAAERGHHVALHEASPHIGGQFRLAGMQPRRGQILDLMDWYERQFVKLGVALHLNSFVDDLAAHEADQIIIATGSLPDDQGLQRWRPDLPSLPGIELGHVYAPEDVLRRAATLGDAVILYDEGGNWRGVGTAWYLAEQGKSVTIVTPDPFVGREIARTAADGAARKRMAQLGVNMRSEHCLTAWHGNGATIRNMLTGADETIPASSLVMATTNNAFDPFPETVSGKTLHRIGDCAAPRLAAYAFYEGRKLALGL